MGFENYTDRARSSFQRAQNYANKLHHEYVRPEHLLLGLMDDANSLATWALRSVSSLSQIRSDLLELLTPGPEMVTIGRLPHTPAMKRVLEKTVEASRLLDHSFVSSEHLLLGLARVETPACDIMKNHGANENEVLKAIVGFLANPTDEILTPMLLRCLDCLREIRSRDTITQDQSKADLRLAQDGLEECVRWYSEYRVRLRFPKAAATLSESNLKEVQS